MNTETKSTHCLNCGNTFTGQFCPRCGQKADVKRLQFIELMRNTIGPFVGGDGKAANTCRDLFLRPGHMVRDYLLGKRVRYYNPLQMYVFVVTAFAIVSYILGVHTLIFDFNFSDFKSNSGNGDHWSIDFVITNLSAFFSNKLYGTFFFALLATFPARLVFRKKIQRPDGTMQPLNLTEQFYVGMFHSCLETLVSILLLPLCMVKGMESVVAPVYQIISTVYVVVMYKQLLGMKWAKTILFVFLYGFLAVLLAFVLFVAVMVVGALIVEKLMQ